MKKKKIIALIALLVTVAIVAILIGIIIVKNVNMAGYAFLTEDNGDGTCSVVGVDHYSGLAGEETMTVPAEIDGKRVTRIKNIGTEFQTKVKEIVISEGVTAVEEGAFYSYRQCEKITFPASLTEIGAHAAVSTAEVVFAGNDVLEFRERCFIEKEAHKIVCDFSGAAIPADVRAIGDGVFTGTDLSGLDLSSILSVGKGAFVGAHAAVVDLSSVKVVGGEAFMDSTIDSLTLAGGVTLGDLAFASVRTTSIRFMGVPASCGTGVFGTSSATEITFDGTQKEFEALRDMIPVSSGIPVHCSDGDLPMEP